MRTSTLKWIIALMGISLVGMIGFQLYWIDSMIVANEERFQKDVIQAMNNVALKLEKQETVAAFNKFQRLNDIKPQWRPQRSNPQQLNAQYQPGLSQDALQNVSESGQDFIPVNNDFGSQGEHVVVMDTMEGPGFQVVFNYEFMNFPSPSSMTEEVRPVKDINEELEMELEEKQSEIESLEDQLDWISRKYQLTTSVIDDLLAPGRKISTRFNPAQLDSLLKVELQDKGINIGYDYGVIAPKLNRFVVLNDADRQDALQTSQLRASLFPNDLTGNGAFLVIDFPGKSGYLLQNIWLTMVSSGILVLIIVLCFGYSIRTIIRQKKLSIMKNDFINNMTHEFKTPIATVSLATEALQDRDLTKSEDRRNRYVKMIREENQRLGSQVERVLQIAAIEKQDFSLVKEELDIHEMIESLVDNLRIQVESRAGRITTVMNAAICEIKGDETHISNCIMNLLDNANKYSPEAPNIIVRTESHRDTLSISVQDHGMGMSKETQNHVFEKFYRLPTGNRHDVKGFGLGLSYVKNMVEAHDGEVRVDSTIGKGSKFTIILPLN